MFAVDFADMLWNIILPLSAHRASSSFHGASYLVSLQSMYTLAGNHLHVNINMVFSLQTSFFIMMPIASIFLLVSEWKLHKQYKERILPDSTFSEELNRLLKK